MEGKAVNEVRIYLFAFEFDLEILCRFLSDSASEIKLIDLAVFVP